MTGGPDDRPPFYGRARIAGGLLLYGLAFLLMLVDAFSEVYAVDSIQLGLLLGTGTVLLGVEAGRKLLDGR